MFNIDVFEKNITEIKTLLSSNDYDALIIPHDDEFISEYVPNDKQRLSFITGFTGSAGVCIIFSDLRNSVLFVDGRYQVQAKKQVPECIEVKPLTSKFDVINFLNNNLKKNQSIAFDANIHTWNWYKKAEEILSKNEIKLIPTKQNFVDQVWRTKPIVEKKPLVIFPQYFVGTSSQEKREMIADIINKENLDALFLFDSESVNWILNIRGHDIPYLPIVRCFAIMYSNQSIDVFINNEKLISSQFAQQCGNDVSLFSLNKLQETLKRIGSDKLKIGVDFQKTSTSSILTLQKAGAEIIDFKDPCEYPRAIKTNIEVDGFREAHLKDGVAMCQFLAWLDRRCNDPNNEETEETIANQAQKYREDQENFIELSFATISALGPNAAMCHYNHQEAEKPRKLGLDPLYLIDSGAHYYEGTTDITRTIAIKEPTDEMIDNFTRVLKGNIALSQALFPIGTKGCQLDILARQPLWEKGLDYAHGTGHGVGHCLSVHEGPHRISCNVSNNDVPLAKNMIVTNEPGYYKENEYGIRCENELLIVEKEGFEGKMLQFEILTLVPFDLKLINEKILTENEIKWINNYHKTVREKIKPFLSDRDISWLLSATKQIETDKNKE